MADRELLVRILGDDRQLQRAFVRSERGARAFESRMEGVNQATRGFLSGFGSRTSLLFGSGAFVGATALSTFSRQAVTAASDLEEQMNKVSQVFGEASDEVQDWSKATAEGLGISQRQALAAAGTFGNLFRVIELAPSQAARMSQALVQLAADLASFNNANPEDVLVALRSGLIGEAEPLRRYGVLLSEARVQQVAMADTGKKNVKALTDQEKALARFSIIMQDTASAQGDFARTSDSLANQTRQLRAEIDDLSASVGGVLLPFVTNLTRGFNESVGALNAVADAVDNLGGADFQAVNASFAELVGRFEELQGLNASFVAPELERLAPRIREIAGELNRLGASNRVIAAFRQASEQIDQALRDGVITPLEAAQLETEELGRLFLSVVPRDVLVGLGASVRSGLEDATAAARTGVADLAAEIHSGIEDMSRQAVLDARAGGEGVGNAFAEGLLAASGRIQGQLAGLGEQVLRAQIAGDEGAELAALRRQEQRLRQQLRIQEQIRAAGGRGAPTAQKKIRDEILPELRGVTQSINSILEAQERATKQAADTQERVEREEARLLESRRRQEQRRRELRRQAQQERRRGDQFEAIGLTREGAQRVPGAGALRQRLGNLRQQVQGTVLDTAETEKQLDRIAAVLKGRFGKVGRDVRAAILQMLNDISSALEGKGAKTGPMTAFQKRGIGQLTAGLGLSEEEIKALRQRFAQLGPGGTAPGKGIAAFGLNVQPPKTVTTKDLFEMTPMEFRIYIDGEEVEARVTRRQQKKRGRTAPSRRGVRPGM